MSYVNLNYLLVLELNLDLGPEKGGTGSDRGTRHIFHNNSHGCGTHI